MDKVVEHLRRYGLQTKPPEALGGARVLGLRLSDKGRGPLMWTRGNLAPQLNDELLTRRKLFSLCGRLVGHYPIAGWLRVACSFMKRHSEGRNWEDPVGDMVTSWLRHVLERVHREDPVHGHWAVSSTSSGRVWCDASSLAIGTVLQIADVFVEDAAWLRSKHDAAHINVAELDSVIQGLNMAIRWHLKTISIMTDSATVHKWMQAVLMGSHRIRCHGLSEILIKRRLSMIAELIKTYSLTVSVELVTSATNKADVLTRVPRAWLQELKRKEVPVCAVSQNLLEQQHQRHHFGVERTLHLARQVGLNATRNEVERVVRECQRCKSIDPAPMKWRKGRLSVDECWKRLDIDTTHYDKDRYLSAIDCGPSRYRVWRRINTEDAVVVAAVLESIFIELGPPEEILLDNSTTFRSEHFQKLCKK